MKLILTIILQKQLQLCNCQLTLCVHPSKHASLALCVRVCVCEMCLHASVHNVTVEYVMYAHGRCILETRRRRGWALTCSIAHALCCALK